MKKKAASKKILERRRRLWEIALFLIKFNLLAIPLYILLYLNFSIPQLQVFLTDALYQTLKALCYPITSNGYFIYAFFKVAKGYVLVPFEISMDCTGWKTMYALFALTIATPSENKEKLNFLLWGLPLLFFINFVRILTTIMFSFQFGYQYLDVVHTFLWREGLIFAVVLIWFLWLRKQL